ncbi:MAG: hypothetical protein QOH56_2221 [Pseudonocardiales bacterium]|jgi:hypothetical protein|nr:hypothetical protein [Frankiales bacterium]MDQ1690398.1 hypothetical protein [Pseudonocardiales bacterium]MDQ1735970.1 hypothetical protein [Pseudonocardiales bacterium]
MTNSSGQPGDGADPSAAGHTTQDESQYEILPGDDADGVHSGGGQGDRSGDDPDVTAQIEQPAKVMRIGTMIKQLLEEVRAAPLDEAGRQRLKEIHQSSIKELEDGLSTDLKDELDRLSLPFDEDHVPSEAELRIAQAQLVGWLEGLFHGIQTALFAQQMAARAQLEQMRGRALPGQIGPGTGLGPGMTPGVSPEHGTGQYL